MATKVKGDKIKEGSIPLSALDDDFKFRYSNCPSEEHLNIQTIDLTNFKVGDTFTINKSYTDFYIGKKLVQPSAVRYQEVHIKTYGTYVIPYNGPTLTVNISPGNSSTIMEIISGTNTGANCIVEVYTKSINKLDKKFLPDDIGGADWNAQEGDAGYIENKPKFVEKLKTYSAVYSYDNIDEPTLTELLPIEIQMDDVMHFIAKSQSTAHPDLYFNVKKNQDYTTIRGNGINTFKIKIQYGQIYVIPMMDGTQKITALKVVDLNESSLNNNVITTFKQELSEENKNQALANLGIDPVVWKYMYEPYIIESENFLPDYLHQLLVNNNPLILNLCKIKVVTEIYDEYADANRPIVHFCTPIAHKFDDVPDTGLSLQCITFYDNTYHTYHVDIDESNGQIYDITEIVPNENNS